MSPSDLGIAPTGQEGRLPLREFGAVLLEPRTLNCKFGVRVARPRIGPELVPNWSDPYFFTPSMTRTIQPMRNRGRSYTALTGEKENAK